MNIIPALMKQKVLLIAGAAILLILIGGAAYVSQNGDLARLQQDFQLPGTRQPAESIALTLVANPISQTETEYTLMYAEAEEKNITGMSIRLVAFTDRLTEQSINFSLTPALVEQGWQAPLSTASVESSVDTTTFIYELALLRISTDPVPLAPSTVLGSFTITGNTDSVVLELDPSISTAILSDGTEVQLTLAR